MCEFVNGSLPLYVFANCIKYLAKEGYKFFVSQDSKEIIEGFIDKGKIKI